MSKPSLGLTARAVVARVVDGDTVDVYLTLPVRMRLLDCWAPETHGIDRIAGERAKEFLEKLLPQGAPVEVHVPTGDADALGSVLTFGRVLGHIYRPNEQETVSELMVGAGLATEAKG